MLAALMAGITDYSEPEFAVSGFRLLLHPGVETSPPRLADHAQVLCSKCDII